MKLATFNHTAGTGVGVVVGDEIVDLAATSLGLPQEMTELLAAGPDALAAAGRAVQHATSRIPLDEVRLEAPIRRPPKILAIGLNYADHVAESGLEAGLEAPKVPTVFNKQSTAVTGPYEPIHLPRVSTALDYEGELGLVIGRRCRHVPKQRAREVIAGYLVVNDVSVRDWQLRSPTMTMGKSFDTHCPLGPWITTADEVGDPHSLGLRTWVDGELRQDSNTKELIYDRRRGLHGHAGGRGHRHEAAPAAPGRRRGSHRDRGAGTDREPGGPGARRHRAPLAGAEPETRKGGAR
jgi:2-keto-4-pentenoate hydratase/2-oxohepta-3-ene-1,7-dioic acid hydratase in catechol pathway